MYKILKGIAPGYLRELFTHVNEDNEYNLRSSDINVKIPQLYTEYLKRSLSYDGATLWNSLPNSIRNVSTLQTFQNLINVYCFKYN